MDMLSNRIEKNENRFHWKLDGTDDFILLLRDLQFTELLRCYDICTFYLTETILHVSEPRSSLLRVT